MDRQEIRSVLATRGPLILICGTLLGMSLSRDPRISIDARAFVTAHYAAGVTVFYCSLVLLDHAIGKAQSLLSAVGWWVPPFAVANLVLSWARAMLNIAQLNLALTTLSHLFTWVNEESGEPTDVLGIVSDARFQRLHPRTVGWCQGTWSDGESEPQMVFTDGRPPRENVAGKLAWYIENTAIGTAPDAVETLVGALSSVLRLVYLDIPSAFSCFLLLLRKTINWATGLSFADQVFQSCMLRCEPPAWTKRRGPAPGSLAVHLSGVVGHRDAWAALVAKWRGRPEPLQNAMGVTGLVHAMGLFPEEGRRVIATANPRVATAEKRLEVALANPLSTRELLGLAMREAMDAKVTELEAGVARFETVEVMQPLAAELEGLGLDMTPVKELVGGGPIPPSVLALVVGSASDAVRRRVDRGVVDFVDVNCADFDSGACDPLGAVYGGQMITFKKFPIIHRFMRDDVT